MRKQAQAIELGVGSRVCVRNHTARLPPLKLLALVPSPTLPPPTHFIVTIEIIWWDLFPLGPTPYLLAPLPCLLCWLCLRSEASVFLIEAVPSLNPREFSWFKTGLCSQTVLN